MRLVAESLTSKADRNALILAIFLTWTIISVIECISFVGNIFLEFEKNFFAPKHALNDATVFGSPEHEVLMVSYCDQSLSVVRALSTFCFKGLLIQNG